MQTNAVFVILLVISSSGAEQESFAETLGKSGSTIGLLGSRREEELATFGQLVYSIGRRLKAGYWPPDSEGEQDAIAAKALQASDSSDSSGGNRAGNFTEKPTSSSTPRAEAIETEDAQHRAADADKSPASGEDAELHHPALGDLGPSRARLSLNAPPPNAKFQGPPSWDDVKAPPGGFKWEPPDRSPSPPPRPLLPPPQSPMPPVDLNNMTAFQNITDVMPARGIEDLELGAGLNEVLTGVDTNEYVSEEQVRNYTATSAGILLYYVGDSRGCYVKKSLIRNGTGGAVFEKLGLNNI
ncbi:hypothetical protein CYMTET_36750 [Cymbomonas tetramitiformis]|uniref:Uncharacterized protein n=1 Tax=Cymbomonas tetramitiformis TaxID=36881 RepID=A0AAE0CGV7_9CHLO|nr:hypothetical protein CYMTET_36750 [Cymbomonas tetramitiformis]